MTAGGNSLTEPHTSPVTGINFSLTNTGVHNSATGWADIVAPGLSYRLNRHFSMDANASWLPTVNAYVQSKGNTQPVLRTGSNLFGDTFLAAHADSAGDRFDDSATVTLGLPSGSVRYGLGAGSTTYNVTNHLEYNIGIFTPDIEAGIGNNSSLANSTVHKAYVATGQIANFQAGTSVGLPLNLSLDVEGYENLPLADQTVNGTVTRKGKNGKGQSTQVLAGAGNAEDNGINTELDLPLGRHLMLMGLYEHSFVQGLDTASAGLTWTLRAPKLSQ